MVYLENPPNTEALEEDLAWEKTFAEESEKRRDRSPFLHSMGRAPKQILQSVTKRNKLLNLIERYFKPGPILDVGCAGGHTLKALSGDYIPFGIEISQELSAVASRAFVPRGGAVIQADASTGLAQLPKNHFSGVVMTSFLEHDTDARKVLQATREIMREGSRLIIKVPNYGSLNRIVRGSRWCGFRFPDHVNYFTPETLKKMLEAAGLTPVRFTLLDRLPTSDNMWLVARRALTTETNRSSDREMGTRR